MEVEAGARGVAMLFRVVVAVGTLAGSNAVGAERPEAVQFLPGDGGVLFVPRLSTGGTHGTVAFVPSSCDGEFAG